MYIYQLTYEDEGSLLMIGYFGSWKKARSVMKKYRSTLPGFKEYPNCFIIKKMKESYDILYALISIFVLFFIQLLIGICGSKFSILPSTHDEISFWTYDMTNWLCYTNPFVRLLDFIIGCNLGYLFLNIKFKSCLKIKYYTLFEIIAIVLFIVANIIYVYNRQDINSGSNVIWSSPRRWWTYTIIFTPISCALILLFAYGKGGISNNLVCNQLLYVAKISPTVKVC